MKTFLLCYFAIGVVLAAALADPKLSSFEEDLETPEIEGRVISGRSASRKKFPYQVAINSRGWYLSLWCGGSILSQNWVLTSADCVYDSRNLTIYYGAVKLNKYKAAHTLLSKSSVIIHSKYHHSTLTNNIALVKTPSIPFSSYVGKIELPRLSPFYANTYAGETAIFTGWGITKQNGGSHSNSLKYASYKVLTQAQCKNQYGTVVDNSDVICVATPKKKGPCTGDNGSPLTLRELGRNIQIGIMSFWRFEDCKKSPAAVLTRVTSYLDWIRNHAGISY